MKAFTLIDVLVSILVVAVLMAIAIPSLANAKASAKTAQCRNQARQNAVLWMAIVEESQWKKSPVRSDFEFITCPQGGTEYDLLTDVTVSVLRQADQRAYGGIWPVCWDSKGEHLGKGVRARMDGSVELYDPDEGVYSWD